MNCELQGCLHKTAYISIFQQMSYISLAFKQMEGSLRIHSLLTVKYIVSAYCKSSLYDIGIFQRHKIFIYLKLR